ncbi:hypothetical protein AVEN_143162-1 [Araneus ventricosus]|uniref:Uncharacterized protein n=1 Tax=Araneus ventricosus TaxID=182803 RepID=A0A4Y2JUP9_ARAVE|nr:hypothetical protein AVEN_143162-1 [Araneus ventricosus]
MAQEPFLAKLRQSNGKTQHSGTKISESGLDTSIVEDESEATLILCESQLENINGETSTSLQAEDICQNDEPANTFPIYGGPPRKKRKRTEIDEILAAATSALKSLGSRQG